MLCNVALLKTDGQLEYLNLYLSISDGSLEMDKLIIPRLSIGPWLRSRTYTYTHTHLD